MRVIAGRFRGRQLRSLRGADLRATSDRLRETLFDILGPAVEDSLFVDVFAGTGAVGIEALSRGARGAVFIEQQPAAIKLIRSNLAALGISAGAEVLATDWLRGLEILAARHAPASFIFLDPPYAAEREWREALAWLGESRLLAPNGRVVVEHSRRRKPPERFGALELARLVEQGDAALSFYRLTAAA